MTDDKFQKLEVDRQKVSVMQNELGASFQNNFISMCSNKLNFTGHHESQYTYIFHAKHH